MKWLRKLWMYVYHLHLAIVCWNILTNCQTWEFDNLLSSVPSILKIWDTAGQERFRSQWAGTWGTDKMHQFTYIKMIQYAFIWPRKWCSQWFSINSLWNLWTLRCHRCHRHFFRNLTASCRCAGPLQRATTVEPTASSWPSMSQQLGAHDSGPLLLS